MNKKVIIVGGFHEIIELCEESGYSIAGIIDNHLSDQFMGYSVLGSDEDANQIFKNYVDIPLVITPDSPAIREKLFHLYSSIGFTFSTIISLRSKISKSAIIGEGTIIQDNVNVSANARIGKFVKLNTGCNVMHDCFLDDFVTIAPGAVVLGRVNIGTKSYVGANATVLPERTIVENVVIGAGAVVTRDIKGKGKVYVGVPAKEIVK